MKFWKVCVLFLVLGFAACKSDREEPENLISAEVMTDIMYDIGLTEASYRGRVYNDTLSNEKVRQRIQFTFNKHQVTQEQFEKSYEYYMEDPKLLIEIYNEVLARYSTKLSEVEEAVDE